MVDFGDSVNVHYSVISNKEKLYVLVRLRRWGFFGFKTSTFAYFSQNSKLNIKAEFFKSVNMMLGQTNRRDRLLDEEHDVN